VGPNLIRKGLPSSACSLQCIILFTETLLKRGGICRFDDDLDVLIVLDGGIGRRFELRFLWPLARLHVGAVVGTGFFLHLRLGGIPAVDFLLRLQIGCHDALGKFTIFIGVNGIAGDTDRGVKDLIHFHRETEVLT